jgi:hypothetical protein
MSEETQRCQCGKIVEFWSALLQVGVCSEECYWSARNTAGFPEGPYGASVPWKGGTK